MTDETYQFEDLKLVSAIPAGMGREDVVTAWIASQHAVRDSEEHKRSFWAFTVMYDLCEDRPAVAWELIQLILKQDQSQKIIQILSAGPLEDLLAKHGPDYIEKVEVEAKSNPQFASLLGGVWQNSMSEDVWNRVLEVRDRRGWDGNPG
jgi:hypothetical protein